MIIHWKLVRHHIPCGLLQSWNNAK